jgi:beta-N-acetylhexosaminidase
MNTARFLFVVIVVFAAGGVAGYLFIDHPVSKVPVSNENVNGVGQANITAPMAVGKEPASDTRADDELRAKIGQMLIVGFRGTEIGDDSKIARQIAELNLGGVILFDYDNPSKSFPRNIVGPAQTKELIARIQGRASVPLFISVDAEGGKVNRLKEEYGFKSFLGAQELGWLDDLEKTRSSAAELGDELKGLGFNLNFAPVVDVNVNPANPVIGKLGRSFSADPQVVAAQAAAFIAGQHDSGIVTAIKHFPGHGSSLVDSHLGLVDVTETYQQKELIPFRSLIDSGQADMVMSAHIMNTNIDPDYPATLSPLFLRDILRGQLGFGGIIVSDDMQMGAIVKNYGFKDALVRAVNAGCDILILSNNGTVYDEDIAAKASDALVEAVRTGQISRDRINDSWQRIISVKEKFGILK